MGLVLLELLLGDLDRLLKILVGSFGLMTSWPCWAR
jgi:hypothetical protein